MIISVHCHDAIVFKIRVYCVSFKYRIWRLKSLDTIFEWTWRTAANIFINLKLNMGFFQFTTLFTVDYKWMDILVFFKLCGTLSTNPNDCQCSFWNETNCCLCLLTLIILVSLLTELSDVCHFCCQMNRIIWVTLLVGANQLSLWFSKQIYEEE